MTRQMHDIMAFAEVITSIMTLTQQATAKLMYYTEDIYNRNHVFTTQTYYM